VEATRCRLLRMCDVPDFWDHRAHESVEPDARSAKPLAGCAKQSRRRPVGKSAMKTAELGQAKIKITDASSGRIVVRTAETSALRVTNRIYPLPARSLLCVLLIALGCELQPSEISRARADESSDALYPGRYVANCKPAPIVGCLCGTDTAHASIFPQSVSDASDPTKLMRDGEYSQMVKWLRLTCQTIRR
jgi:hypothetical protein